MNEPKIAIVEHCGSPTKSDATGLPHRCRVILSAPEFMQVAFIFLRGGSESFVFACADEQTAEHVVRTGHADINAGQPICAHPRFIRHEHVPS